MGVAVRDRGFGGAKELHYSVTIGPRDPTNIVGGAMGSNTTDIDPDFEQSRDTLLAFLEAL